MFVGIKLENYTPLNVGFSTNTSNNKIAFFSRDIYRRLLPLSSSCVKILLCLRVQVVEKDCKW